MPLLLQEFAAALDAAAATPGKLAKQKRLAELLKSLDAADLSLAVRYSIGRPFGASDERVIGVSSRIVSDVALQLTATSPADYRAAVIRRGEIGEAVADLWHLSELSEPPLALQELAAAFDRLAATTQPLAKRPVVVELFSRCATPREACYLAKIILGDLRTGVREGIVQASVAEAFGVSLAEVLRAQLLQGDLEAVALLAAKGELASAKFTLFRPMQFMLAKPIESPSDAPGDWQIEDKLDGIRTQAHKQGDTLHLYTRTMDRTDDSFPGRRERRSHNAARRLVPARRRDRAVPGRPCAVTVRATSRKALGRGRS